MSKRAGPAARETTRRRAPVGSNAGDGAAAVAASGTGRRWILSPTADGLLVIGAPALSALVLLPLAAVLPAEAIWLAVMSFGAVGHHLPGFLRAYGDRSLFRRYAWRFVLAPPLLLTAALWLSFRDLHALALLTLGWSFWHGLMQHYGFLRIYDAKAGSVSAGAAWMDWLVTVGWFLACFALSGHQTGELLEALEASGAPAPPPGTVATARVVLAAACVAVSVAWVWRTVRARRAGLPVSGLKVALLVSTTAFVVFARVLTRDPLLSVALFELLHDVQYLAIVWAFNRRRVETRADESLVSRLLFQPSAGRVVAYVGLCLAYGGAAYLATRALPDDAVRKVVLAVFSASALLHFYYDGFIWRIRQAETSRALDIAGAATAAGARPATPTGTAPRRGLLHALAVALPLVLFASLEEAAGTKDDGARAVAWASALVEARPARAQAHARLGDALARRGDHAGAAAAWRRALELGPPAPSLHNNLANALDALGRRDEALAHQRAAVALAPSSTVTRTNLGLLLDRMGRAHEAVDAFAEAARLAPSSAEAHANLGAALVKAGRRSEGLAELRESLRLDPTYAPARANLDSLGER